jgi:hypothetical protein
MLRDPITLGIAGACALTGVAVSLWQVRSARRAAARWWESRSRAVGSRGTSWRRRSCST